MKWWNVLIGCVIVALMMSFCHIEQAEAKTRPTYKTITIPIQKGKTYQLYAFMKKLEKEYAESAAEHFYSIRRAIKKGKKVTLSGKGLTIKKKTFKAKKTGEYKLKVKIKKKCYVFSFCAVEKIYKLKPSGIAGIKILTRAMGETTTVEVKDREVINQIVNKINQAKYVFNFTESMLMIIGGKDYYVELYASDGSPPKVLGLLYNKIQINNICWTSDSSMSLS